MSAISLGAATATHRHLEPIPQVIENVIGVYGHSLLGMDPGGRARLNETT